MGLGSIVGGIAGAAGSVVGGLLGQSASARANEQNYQAQKEFAQNGIRWRVADAKAAGLHPLAALGAQAPSYTPSTFVGDTSFLGDVAQNLGQSIGRAAEAKMTARERARERAIADQSTALLMENSRLKNEFLQTQIAAQKQDMALQLARSAAMAVRTQQAVPGMPSVGVDDGAVIAGQAQSLRGANGAFPTGAVKSDTSTVPTSVRGVPSVQAGTPPDVRFYLGSHGTRVPLPTESAADAMDAAFLSGVDWSVRNKLLPILSNYLPFIEDPNRRPGEYFDPFYGGYRKGKTFYEKWFK